MFTFFFTYFIVFVLFVFEFEFYQKVFFNKMEKNLFWRESGIS